MEKLIIIKLHSLMEFTSRQLRAFHLVAQHQSFTRAAEALFITPSGLSVMIRELETQLGFRLFDRTTRHVVLTRHGQELLAATRRNLEEIDSAMSRIGRTAMQGSQSLSIGAQPLVASNVLPPAIREFRSQRPSVTIHLYDSNSLDIQERLQAGQLDVGVGIFPSAEGIRCTPFFRFSLMAIRPEHTRTTLRTSISWSALHGKRLVALRTKGPVQQLIEKCLERARVVPDVVMAINSLDTLIAMVEAGEGMAVIPSFGLPACRNRRVVMMRLVNPIATLDFHLIQHRGRRLPSVVGEFTSFLQSYIARWAGRANVL